MIGDKQAFPPPHLTWMGETDQPRKIENLKSQSFKTEQLSETENTSNTATEDTQGPNQTILAKYCSLFQAPLGSLSDPLSNSLDVLWLNIWTMQMQMRDVRPLLDKGSPLTPSP